MNIQTLGLLLFKLLLLTHFVIAYPDLKLRANEETESSKYCYSSDPNPYIYFSSKTNYQYTHGDLNNIIEPEGCKPVQLWAFIRHGTRYADKSQLEAFESLNKTLMDVKKNFIDNKIALCDDDFFLLDTWAWDKNITDVMAKALSPQGYLDLAGIAERFKKKYPNLLDVEYNEADFYFQYTTSQRTHDSFVGYINGLFENNSSHIVGIESDNTIKDIKNCEAWSSNEDGTEAAEFRNTLQYKTMISRVTKRLGYRENIDEDLLKTIYDNCVFEKAWYPNEKSKWCVSFTSEDLKILEYESSLKKYYADFYGNAYSELTGCPVVKDLFERFENTAQGIKEETKVTVLFTHSTPLTLFISSLGLYRNEEIPTSENYIPDEGWRTSSIVPFAGNFASILYKCEEDSYKVQFILNERPVQIDESCVEGLCSWDEIRPKLENTVTSCNLDFCNLK